MDKKLIQKFYEIFFPTSGAHAVRVVNPDGSNTGDSAYITMVDVASSTVTYLGSAAAGSATSAAVWKIKKVLVASTITTISFASGSTAFDQIWDNRASLSYS